MKHQALDEMVAELQSLRVRLDDADSTTLGDLGKLLDKMTKHCDRALHAAQRLEDA